MTATRFTLDDVGFSLSARALCAFASGLPRSSRTFAAAFPERADEAARSRPEAVPGLVAAAVDELRMVVWSIAQAHSRADLRRYMPEPIWRAAGSGGAERVGRGAVPVSEFEEWWEGA